MRHSEKPGKPEKARSIARTVLSPIRLFFAHFSRACKLSGTRKRQITAGILCAVMILTMLPMMSLTAFAATGTPLTFTAQVAGSSVALNYKSGDDVMYKKGDGEWTAYTLGDPITLANKNDTVSFKGTGVTTDSGNHLVMTGRISASGDVTSLTNGVGGDATLTEGSYKYMFSGCTSLTTPPALPSTALAESCYVFMFCGCTSLTEAPALPATTLATSCYSAMFQGCTSLTEAPELRANTLTAYCYSNMFNVCKSLTTAPALPATALAAYCYNNMFYGCTSLTEAPELRANTLTAYCYSSMFSDCTSLTEAPALHATRLASYCCQRMFYGCTKLTKAPELRATALADHCYDSMFYLCTSLTEEPALPATRLADYCYSKMFYDCKAITTVPELPATMLADHCYNFMFAGCSSIKICAAKDGNYTKEWRVPSTGTAKDEAGWSVNMFLGTSVTFSGSLALNTTYYIYKEPIPLTFTAQAAGSSVALNYKSGDDVMYKKGDGKWTAYTMGGTIALADKNDTVSFKGTGVTTDSGNHFVMTGRISASGDVTSLTNGVGGDATLTEGSYKYMFSGCTSLTTPPELPASALADSCYSSMFSGCTSLKISTTAAGNYTKEWRIPTTEASEPTANDWNAGMLSGTGGAFTEDPAVNTTYYIYEDLTPPAISGIEDGKTYCITAEFTVSDADLAAVTANGTELTAVNGTYKLTAAGKNVVVATDRSGNSVTATVTVNAGHSWNSGAVTAEPTVTAKGVKTYTCSVCGGTKTEEIPMLAPSVTEGGNASYTEGGKEGLTFRSNAALADLVSVSVDGKVIGEANYITKEGSTIVTLTADYLATLSVGKHTLEIKSLSGTASTEFTIATKGTGQQSPFTGDTDSIVLSVAALFITGGTLTALVIKNKREKAMNK